MSTAEIMKNIQSLCNKRYLIVKNYHPIDQKNIEDVIMLTAEIHDYRELLKQKVKTK